MNRSHGKLFKAFNIKVIWFYHLFMRLYFVIFARQTKVVRFELESYQKAIFRLSNCYLILFSGNVVNIWCKIFLIIFLRKAPFNKYWYLLVNTTDKQSNVSAVVLVGSKKERFLSKCKSNLIILLASFKELESFWLRTFLSSRGMKLSFYDWEQLKQSHSLFFSKQCKCSIFSYQICLCFKLFVLIFIFVIFVAIQPISW